MLQVQLVNLNMTRKVRARSSLFFHKSFLARGFDVSPAARRLQAGTLTALTRFPSRIDRPTIAANTNVRPALRHREEMRAFVVAQ